VLGCIEKVATRNSSKAEDERSLWIADCLLETREADRELLSGAQVCMCICIDQTLTRTHTQIAEKWVLPDIALAALEDLEAALSCARFVAKLALAQLDAEYKQSGFRKAVAAGHMTQVQYEGAMSRVRVPTRADYLQYQFATKRKKQE